MQKIAIILTTLLLLGAKLNAQTHESEPRMVRCYPSHATAFIQFELKSLTKPSTLIIFNGATGTKMLVKVSAGNETVRVNVNEYARGMYVFHLLNPTGGLLDVGKFYVIK